MLFGGQLMETSFWQGKNDMLNEKFRLPSVEVHFGVWGCGLTVHFEDGVINGVTVNPNNDVVPGSSNGGWDKIPKRPSKVAKNPWL